MLQSGYVLGHSDRELERLRTQARFLHGVFLAAGLRAPTMRMKTFIGGGTEVPSGCGRLPNLPTPCCR
jgi:hypothetical protein